MIYFIQDNTTCHIKIGYTGSDDAESRRRALQTGNPSALVLLATIPGDQQYELFLHQQFAADRVAGEWFRPVPDLLLLIIASLELNRFPVKARSPAPLRVPAPVPG